MCNIIDAGRGVFRVSQSELFNAAISGEGLERLMQGLMSDCLFWDGAVERHGEGCRKQHTSAVIHSLRFFSKHAFEQLSGVLWRIWKPPVSYLWFLSSDSLDVLNLLRFPGKTCFYYGSRIQAQVLCSLSLDAGTNLCQIFPVPVCQHEGSGRQNMSIGDATLTVVTRAWW